MSKYSVEELEALNHMQKMWSYIAENGGNKRQAVEYLGLRNNYLHNCSLCELAKSTCRNCLGKDLWNSGTCEDDGTPYYLWDTYQDAIELLSRQEHKLVKLAKVQAAIIANWAKEELEK